jgi:type II secretory pathway predicted ATPase ExeA
MYKSFFGLRENPFNANPDPRYLFLTREIQEALAGLAYGIKNRKGFILLTGEVGTGKTTLLNRLLDWLNTEGIATAYVFNSQVDVTQLFDFMLADFGIPCESRDKSHVLMRLNQWLLERFRDRKTTVLIVDEAQNLSPQVLEEIRLLTNFETANEKLLQIVLSGQPELEDKLRDPRLRQLRQRITMRCRTQPLNYDEMAGYIAERLRIGGANGRPIFSAEAIETIYKYSRGIPRVANLLCEHSLINAFVEQVRPVPANAVEEAAHEFELDEWDPTARPKATVGGEDRSKVVDEFLRSLQNLLQDLGRANASVPTDAGERKT